MESKKFSKIGIWGRSMGAASTLLFSAKYYHPMIGGIVLDSPFSSL